MVSELEVQGSNLSVCLSCHTITRISICSLSLQLAVLARQVVLACQAGGARTAVRAAQQAVAARLGTMDH